LRPRKDFSIILKSFSTIYFQLKKSPPLSPISTQLKVILFRYTKTPEEFLKDFFVETTLADKQMKEIVPPIADYDSERPTIARKQVKYDSKIIIRSRPNPNLEA